jgi:hypothetical protein
MNLKPLIFITAFNLSLISTAVANDSEVILESLPSIEHPVEDIQSAEDIELYKSEIENTFGKDIESNSSIMSDDQLNSAYSHLDPTRMVPSGLLKKAVSVFHNNKSLFNNQKYISIVNFSARSHKQRMFVVDMNSGKVQAVRTAHGTGSDANNDGYVESLGNVNNSHKSSRGYYKVAEIYSGRYGRSIRLDGLSSSNSNVRSRAIVIHGSDYVKESNVLAGRSWGCFALAWSVKDSIVSRISGGSLLYADWQ